MKIAGAALATVLMGLSAAQAQHVLNLRDADIKVLIEDVSELTGRTFIVDPRVQGRVTVASQEELTPQEVFQVFVSTLSVSGFAVTPAGAGAYKIIPDENAANQATALLDDTAAADQFVTDVLRVRFVDVREAQAAIRPILSRRGQLTFQPGQQVLIIVDTVANIERAREILRRVDIDVSVTELIALEHTSAQEIARIISSVAQNEFGDNAARTGYAIIPVPSSNSILYRGDRAYLPRVRAMVGDMDQLGRSDSDVSVNYLKYARAADLAPILERLAGSIGGGAAGAEGGAPVSIDFHAPTNAVIISGEPGVKTALSGVVQQLDIPRAQVLVEAIIVEIQDDANRELGLQFFLSGSGDSAVPVAVTNFARTQPNILAATGSAIFDEDDLSEDALKLLSDVAVRSLLGINGLALGAGGEFGDGNIFSVILTALDDVQSVNILSTPSLMVLDNEQSSNLVGQEIPVTTGEVLGADNDNPFRTVQRQEIGLKLEVTPQINEGDKVKLDLRVEVSNVVNAGAGFQDVVTDKREIITSVMVSDGEIIVLGGLIDEQETITESKVPLLGDIPGVGRLFQTRGRSNNKTNLMVFIRPTIVRDDAGAGAVTTRKYNFMQAQQLLTTGADVSALSRLMENVIGPEPGYEPGTGPAARDDGEASSSQ